MMELVGSITAALYAALSAFVIAAQAFAPLLPWQASVALSGLVAAVAAVTAWMVTRFFRAK